MEVVILYVPLLHHHFTNQPLYPSVWGVGGRELLLALLPQSLGQWKLWYHMNPSYTLTNPYTRGWWEGTAVSPVVAKVTKCNITATHVHHTPTLLPWYHHTNIRIMDVLRALDTLCRPPSSPHHTPLITTPPHYHPPSMFVCWLSLTLCVKLHSTGILYWHSSGQHEGDHCTETDTVKGRY